MSNAIAGVGTRFKRWDGTDSWDAISEILSISGPGLSRDTIEVTNLDSTDGFKEFIGSFRDGGDVTLSMNFTRAGYDLLKADFDDDDPGNYEIVLPDAGETSFEFVGWVRELPLNISTDSQITLDVTIKVTGKVTVNSGAASDSP